MAKRHVSYGAKAEHYPVVGAALLWTLEKELGDGWTFHNLVPGRHEIDGLQFRLGDARVLAETIRRAATEQGLWDRLRANLPEPPSRAVMGEAFMGLYWNRPEGNAERSQGQALLR